MPAPVFSSIDAPYSNTKPRACFVAFRFVSLRSQLAMFFEVSVCNSIILTTRGYVGPYHDLSI